MKRVSVCVRFPEGKDVLYVEGLQPRNRPSEEFFGVPDSMIHQEHLFLQIANFTRFPVTIEKGRLLGRGDLPEQWLDLRDEMDDEFRVQAVRSLVQVEPTSEDPAEDWGDSEPVGGPKTAETGDPDPIPHQRPYLT